MPVVLVAVTHSSYWALGTRSDTVQWVSFTFTLPTEIWAQIWMWLYCLQHPQNDSHTSVDTVPTVDGVGMQSVSVLNTMGYTGAVCWRVLQHWSVVKLVVLHCVVGEQAPAHAQGRLGGRVGYLRVDYWSRRSCRRQFCLWSHKISTAAGSKKDTKHYRQHAEVSLCLQNILHCHRWAVCTSDLGQRWLSPSWFWHLTGWPVAC